MKTQIISIGKMRDKALKSLFDEYYGRLQHYGSFDEIELKEGRGKSVDQIKSAEAHLILDSLPKTGIVVALDERGKAMSSREFAAWIEELQLRSNKYLSFCIGGADGLHPNILSRADRKICLSSMTLTHEFARVLLTEQLYRAMTILRGEPYHK